MSLVKNANLILSLLDNIDSLEKKGEVRVEDLLVDVCGEDSNIQDWLEDNFGFINIETSTSPTNRHKLTAICSDTGLKQVIEIFDSGQFASQMFSRRGTIFYRIKVSSHIYVDYMPSLGCTWITRQSGWLGEEDNSLIALIYSSRTPLPFGELRVGLIDIINRYFETQGWHTIHAGAVKSNANSKIILITGASSSGKTSLILQLVKCQYHFISNERIFCRSTEEGLQINAFPQPVNVGLGTALHHEELRGFVERPDYCSYYQSRFEPERVWNTPQDQLAELPDKLKILPRELVDAFEAVPTVPAGLIDSIVVPSIGDEPAAVAEIMTAEEVQKVLIENYFASANDQIYPRWLPIEYEYHSNLDPAPLIEKLSQIPAWLVRYNGSQMDSVLPVLQDIGIA